ncbi:hypothetical protein SCUCBS95973_008333 [Sporothrix curviconia]|uniref:Glycosyl hydrolase family 32 N-terminal domain-containing protein n=1 Tax=Sporothrix curviconia TaxID=1260050 RepID=A0ABP0CKP8_9PEZI
MDAFRRFRPISHFIAPHSWSNDPCGALYIPETQDYLLCYQWNPGTTVGGNCAWGMARSKDLTIWEDCPPALWNGTTYDRLGVFSGSIVSRVIQGQRTLFLFYTSVSALPIHWSKPYLQGCESQSVAISTDYGRSWHRSSANPLISAPPRESATTGWRDPFVSQWPSMSTLLGRDHKTNYMMIASGERDVGPQLHMYVSDDMVSWDYLSAVLGAQAGSNVSSNSSFSWGVNFECASFFTLGTTDYIIVGAEESNTSTRHNGHYLLWLSGTLVLRDGKPRFEVISHGVLDSGLLELFQLSRPIEDVGSSQQWTVDEPSGQMTTLGIRPAPQVTALRSPTFSSLETFNMIQSTNFEVEAQFSNLSGNETFIFNVRASPDFKEVSRIIVDLGKKQISIDRM